MNITIDDKFKKTLVDQANIYIDLINSQGDGYLDYTIQQVKEWNDLEMKCLMYRNYLSLRDYGQIVYAVTGLNAFIDESELKIYTIYSAPPPEFYKTCTSLFRLMRTVVAVTFLTK